MAECAPMGKKRTLPKSFTGTAQMPDAPPLPGTRRGASVPPAKGSPVAPPPMWNYEPKEGQSPAPTPKQARQSKAPLGGTVPVVPDTTAEAAASVEVPAVDAKKAADEAEDMAALVETGAALDELSDEIAQLEALLGGLPE
jgi:hypothetical protein